MVGYLDNKIEIDNVIIDMGEVMKEYFENVGEHVWRNQRNRRGSEKRLRGGYREYA